MPSIIWIMVSFVAGLGLYLLFPIAVINTRVGFRQRVGKPYLKMGARCLKQWAFVRRVLSGYDILPINVDDEQKLLNVTLSSKTFGDDQEYRFNDPDNRIKRLWNKPVALAYEQVPAAVDAELAELGHWVREKRINEGIWHGDPEDDYAGVTVDPYVRVKDSLRLVDPIDVFELVANSINPENIKTVEAHTRQRYAKYGRTVTLSDILGVLMGFATGMIAMAGSAYVNERLLDGGSGGGVSNPIDSFGLQLADPTWLDLVVALL